MNKKNTHSHHIFHIYYFFSKTQHHTPENPVNGGDGRRRRVGTYTLRDELLSDLPSEDSRVLTLVLLDFIHHLRRRYLGLGTADHPGRPE